MTVVVAAERAVDDESRALSPSAVGAAEGGGNWTVKDADGGGEGRQTGVTSAHDTGQDCIRRAIPSAVLMP